MPKQWLAFDVGCIECGEGSAVIGTYDTEQAADQAAEDARKRQAEDWHGEHHFLTFDLEARDA